MPIPGFRAQKLSLLMCNTVHQGGVTYQFLDTFEIGHIDADQVYFNEKKSANLTAHTVYSTCGKIFNFEKLKRP